MWNTNRCILPLLWVLVCGVAARGTRKDRDEFHLHIVELGTELEETVIIKQEEEEQIIHVPRHNDVSETTFILDHKQNLTMRLIPQERRCYLSEMDDVSASITPGALQSALSAAEGKRPTSKTTVLRYDWRIVAQVSPSVVSDLSQAMQDLCAELPIYHLERMPEIVSVGNAREPQSAHQRYRRQDLGESKCSYTNQKLRCTRRIASCRYVYVQTCDQSWEQGTRQHYARCVDDNTLHIIDEVVCCLPCCLLSEEADEFYPYCENISVGDVPNEC